MFRRFAVLAVVLIVSVAAQSHGAEQIMIDASGTPRFVSQLNPLPVQTTITIGTYTMVPSEPFDTVQFTNTTASTSSVAVTALAARQKVMIFNRDAAEILWLGIGGANATLSQGLPVYAGQYFEDTLDASVAVNYIASTAISLTIYQAR